MASSLSAGAFKTTKWLEAAVAAPSARRTSRQAQLLGHMEHAVGGSPAERLLRRLGIRVCDDTILRQLLRKAQVYPPHARVAGIAAVSTPMARDKLRCRPNSSQIGFMSNKSVAWRFKST